jgi:deoxyribonuclease IV
VKFGAHIGIGKGFDQTIEWALASDCDCMQIFAGNPRGWRTTPYEAASWAHFANLRKEYQLAPTVIHTSYLINLASSDRSLRTKSAALVAHDLDAAARGKIEYVNTHLGSYGLQSRSIGFDHICSLLAKLIGQAEPGPMLLLENSAGGGNKCGGTIEELGQIVRAVGNRRIGVCLDTAHLWASGYDISNAKAVSAVMEQIGKHIGFKRVRVLHLNDTKVSLGAKHDLHWHIGKGKIGKEGFRALLTQPELAHVACICETPKPHSLDRVNINACRRLAGTRRSSNRQSKKTA